MLVVLTLPIFSEVGFPGLVAIATGFLAANYKFFRLSKSEKVITAVIAILAVSALLWFYMNGR
jgi:O-antigen ligase